ncbi:hypothetical protein [Roseomonas marmotae]|uniref:Uncharacterized protein n=1 Tax=Roseomonas marmotae TaxID=2768161 RepID=A0ABS3K8E6_9PROT|nr:hypothetical protein [Roseomonas marmotae]MBO1073277.1 hypothetical protein [Roseomonas marmotae]QTI79104.1 hypothetical protein IAI58_15955 [Roseomonas marmotae]
MSEYFPTEDVRTLWYDRRALVLGKLREATAPLRAEGLESREGNGWQLWSQLGRWAVDTTTGVPYSSADTLLVLEREMRVTGFGPGKPAFREIRVEFEPGRAVLTEAGRNAVAEASDNLLRFLREGPEVRMGTNGRPVKRQPRRPTKNALAARASYAKAVGH